MNERLKNINHGSIVFIHRYVSPTILKESALNTFCINEIKNKDDIVDVRKVPLRRLDNILDEYNIKKVDYIDIDVEGMELRVLNSINWDVVEIGCILIEQKGMSLDDVLESQVCSLLKSALPAFCICPMGI